MSQTKHEHAWEQATDRDLADYLALSGVAKPPSGFVRLEKCLTCSGHRVITLNSATGQEVPHDPKYGS